MKNEVTLRLSMMAVVAVLVAQFAVGSPARAEELDIANCAVSMEVGNALIAGGHPDKRVLMRFSRRDGKSFPGMAWLPLTRGKFPKPAVIDTSGVVFKDGVISGSFDVELAGVIPKHTYTFEAKYEGNVVYGKWKIKSGDKEGSTSFRGNILVRTPSRDAPFTDPRSLKTTESWGKILDTPHPYMFWTKKEAAAIRKRIETDADAKKQYEVTLQCTKGANGFYNLFKYMVMGDKAAGEAEKRYLLNFIGSHPMKFYTGIGGGRHFDNYIVALRYDILYDLLTPKERKAIEDTFRGFIKHHTHEDYKSSYTRTNWLPNMQWPRPMAAHLMAVAMKDKKAIEMMFNSVGGWKWYMDEYVADGRFYMEEFGKQYSMIGEMLLWCRGLERLGLDKMGYGYTGKGGGTMRNYIESLYDIALPRVENPGGTPSYRHIHMGDAGASCLVAGYAGGEMANKTYGSYFRGANMNGRDFTGGVIPKMLTPLWFEAAHAKWPDGKFDYALAHMRLPNEEKYYPTLLFGVKPVGPKDVTPPPARSFAARERGFAMLRAESGPEYWTSPKPAVALQFGMYYVHYVHDCFSLIEYYAFNRPIYSKRSFGPHSGYAGGHPWADTVRGKNGVVVDNLQVQPIDDGASGCEHQEIRDGFTDAVKFTAVRAKPYEIKSKNYETGEVSTSMKGLYPGVDMERALFLTDEYLFDVFNLKSEKDRLYHWNAHPVGTAAPARPDSWAATKEFDGGKLWVGAPGSMRGLAGKGGFDLKNVMKKEMGDDNWSFKTIQGGKIGVVTHFLGEEGTTAYYDSTGATTLLVQRKKPATVFAVLHEHFNDDKRVIEGYERFAQTEDGIAVKVVGDRKSGIDDRLALAYADKAGTPVTLASKKESFTFTDYAYVRVGKKEVVASGNIIAMKVDVRGRPKLILNGKSADAEIKRGYLVFGAAE